MSRHGEIPTPQKMGAAPSSTSGVRVEDHDISFYRTPLDPVTSEAVHKVSDLKGFQQTLPWVGLLLGSGVASVYFSTTSYSLLALPFALLYGLIANFAINAMHELGHGLVFKTVWVQSLFLRLISFLGWLHPDLFFSSHLRHHRFTQNAPHDQENPMPIKITLWDFLAFGFVNVKGCYEILGQTVRAALGLYPTGHLGWLPGWEEMLYPPSVPQARLPSQVWALFMILGHGAFAFACISHGWYLPPFLLSFGPFYNGWLFFLCNATQHVGLEPGVADFRRNTRTFCLHPFISFLYWHMNWHIEHHMYTQVPCYNLKALHEAIKHDLPPTPNGLLEVWKDVSAAMNSQAQQQLSPPSKEDKKTQ